MADRLHRLVEHLAWADRRAIASVRATPTPAAVRLVSHLVETPRLYLARMQGEDPWPQEFWPERTLEKSAGIAESVHGDLSTFVRALSDADLRRPVAYRTSRGERQVSLVEDMLDHLALHAEHHRGQIAVEVRNAGGEPALTDFIVWTREQATRPARPGDAWPGGMPEPGQTASRTRAVTSDDIARFTAISGDRNPIHYDETVAQATRFGGIVVQGGVTTAILNAVVAEDLPGPGTVFLETHWRFVAPVRPGDRITGFVRVLSVRADKPVTELETRVTTGDGTVVLEGTAVCYTMPLPR